MKTNEDDPVSEPLDPDRSDNPVSEPSGEERGK